MTSSNRKRLPDRASLTGRIMSAGSWSVIQIVTSYVLRLGSNLIMTRLLVPEAFGLIGLISILITAFMLFSDIGIERSIIREKDGDQDLFLRVAWCVKFMRGSVIGVGVLIVALLAWLLAPGLAPEGTVYADPLLPFVIAGSAIIPVIQGAESTAKELTTRRMQNWRFTVIGIAAVIVGTTSMVVFAQINASVWALLCGMIMNRLFVTVMSHLFYKGPRMKLVWDAEIAARLWSYGKFLMGSSALTFVAKFADKLILGGLLSALTFGLYTIALIWIEAGTALINRLADRVGFPALAEVIRSRPRDVPRLFRRFQTVIDLLCLCGFLATFLLGEFLVLLLYTSEYADAGRYLSILSVGLLVHRFQTLNGLMMNIGNSRGMMIVSAIRAVAICITIPLGYRLGGLDGALIATAMTPAVSGLYTIFQLRGVLGTRQSLIDTAIWCVTFVVGFIVFRLA